MTFNPESLFEQYKFTELGGAKDWIAVIFVGFVGPRGQAAWG